MEESSYMQYVDVNNEYGAAISEELPMHGFKWVKKGRGLHGKEDC